MFEKKLKLIRNKIKYKFYKKINYHREKHLYEVDHIQYSEKKILILNPYNDVLIKYWNNIENYEVINASINIDLSDYDKILVCIYFFNHKVKRNPADPDEIVENRSDLNNTLKYHPILATEIKKLLLYKNSQLLLFNPWELIPITSSVIYSLKNLVRKYSILKNKIILSSSDFMNVNKMIKYEDFSFLSYDWSLLIAKRNSKTNSLVIKKSKKIKRVIFLNRRHNRERFICACYLYTNYKNKCLISYLSKPLAPIKNMLYSEKDADNFYEDIPVTLDGDYENVKWHTTEGLTEFISNAYVMIIFETNAVIENNYCQVSEKTFKGILSCMPFMIFSNNPGILKYLKKLGFKTFSPMIDESYDDQYDYDTRYNLFLNAIESICNMSDEKILRFYKKCIPIMEHNIFILEQNEVPKIL